MKKDMSRVVRSGRVIYPWSHIRYIYAVCESSEARSTTPRAEERKSHSGTYPQLLIAIAGGRKINPPKNDNTVEDSCGNRSPYRNLTESFLPGLKKKDVGNDQGDAQQVPFRCCARKTSPTPSATKNIVPSSPTTVQRLLKYQIKDNK